MKLIKISKLSPNHLFRSKKDRSMFSGSGPSSFSSGTKSSSSGNWSDNCGIVSRRELEALLSLLGAETPSQEELMKMVKEFDSEGDGCISVEALMSRIGSAYEPACEAELREAFEFFDTDRDGRITAEELHGVFAAIGDDRCTLDDCRRMIAGVDRNGDGFVCFDDFCRMMEIHA